MNPLNIEAGRRFDRFAVPDSPANLICELLVQVRPQALKNRPNLYFDPSGGQPKPKMNGPVAGVRTVTQIVDG